MFFRLHGVYLVYLALLLLWTWHASGAPRTSGDGGDGGASRSRRPLDRILLVPLLALLAGVLVRDRLAPHSASWLAQPAVAALFPLAFVAVALQNLAVLRARGARLTDVPLILANVGLGASCVVAGAALFGADWGARADALLVGHTVLQHLLGSVLAAESTLSWHLPFLLRRREPEGWGALATGILAAALAGFQVCVLALFQPMARQLVERYALEPQAAAPLRPELGVGVLLRAEHPARTAPPGDFDVWVLAADHPGDGLPLPTRPLVVALRAPERFVLSTPTPEEFEAVFTDGAARLAALLRPQVLLPFPEPDHESIVILGRADPPEIWRQRHAAVQAAVARVSPDTRLAVRLAGHGERSRDLLSALLAEPAVVSIAGPRLAPGSLAAGGPALADTVLDTWERWLDEAEALQRGRAELWVLAAGASPLSCGNAGQRRFVEGCLVRASTRPRVAAILIDGWRDFGGTRGLCLPDGTARPAASTLTGLLQRRAAAAR